MNLIIIIILIVIINIPFGYWRANVKRFSLQWFLAVHLPVPLIIMLRVSSGIILEPISFSILILAFFSGQLVGKKIFERMRISSMVPLTSCLVMDIIRKRNSL